MWHDLWGDFLTRAERLSAGGRAQDAVDATISWQLEGDAVQIGDAVALEHLHVPELYSGCPWRHSSKWVAFVALNPSIDVASIYPTIQDLRAAKDPWDLVPYFEDRFHPTSRDTPLRHGRDPADTAKRPTFWRRAGGQVRPARNQTWSILDNVLRAALQRVGQPDQQGLGVTGAIFDAVPWKFKKWGVVSQELQQELLRAAAKYLRWMFGHLHASVIVATGVDAWTGLATVFPEIAKNEHGPSTFRVSKLTHWTGQEARVVGVHHATRQGFAQIRGRLTALIADDFKDGTFPVGPISPSNEVPRL